MAKRKAEGKHFVLVHGVSHGAWCWHKVKPRLEYPGDNYKNKVTVLDLAASGIDMNPIQDVQTFADYCKPLLDLLASLADNEKVVLVGHSLGGMSIALAMDMFPEKVALGIFLTALIPDTHHKPSYVIDKFVFSGEDAWLDTQLYFDGSKTVMTLGPRFLAINLYQLCPAEDVELAKTLVRPGSIFAEDLSKANNFSEERYGSVPRAYIVCKEDKVLTEQSQRAMIQFAGVSEVREIEGVDHMAMLSKPHQVCQSLLEIASKYI